MEEMSLLRFTSLDTCRTILLSGVGILLGICGCTRREALILVLSGKGKYHSGYYNDALALYKKGDL